MYNFSPTTSLNVLKRVLSGHTWRVAPVSTHHPFGSLPTKFTSSAMAVRSEIMATNGIPSSSTIRAVSRLGSLHWLAR
ncbi:hypothetical protein HanRHA438_Chr13g0617921 [Helianthus annuus]|nr:hypothetical protein HanRHA438_Chr13g0617921 [Helianthus annuus]